MRTIPVTYVNTRKAEELFRHRVLRLLKDKGLLSEERIQLLFSWRRSGSSIDDSVRIPAGQQRAIEHVARYMLRAPVSLTRMRWFPDDSEVFYLAKGSQDDPEAHPLEHDVSIPWSLFAVGSPSRQPRNI